MSGVADPTGGRQSGRSAGCFRSGGLSPATVRYVHAVLRKALADAVRRNQLTRNVADAADAPRQTRPQIRTWSARELRAFVSHVEGDRLYAAYVVAGTTGMRRGEVLGLRWQDVDLDTARVSIVRSLTVVGGYKAEFSEPKTAHGRRMIALDPATVAALREHRERQMLERALMGEAYEDEDLVFCREDGTPLHPDAFSDAFWRRESGETAAHPLPRPAPYARNACSRSRRPPEGGVRAPWSRKHHDHARHVLARDPRDAGDGGSPRSVPRVRCLRRRHGRPSVRSKAGGRTVV